MLRSKWFKYFIEVFSLTFLVGLILGIAVSLIRGYGYAVADFIPGLIGNINHSLIIVFLFLLLYLFIFLVLSRLIKNYGWSCFIAAAVLLAPLFLFWGYRINKVYFHGFFSPEAILWNSVIVLAFVLLWFLVSKGLLFWTRSRILETRPVSLGEFGLLLAVVLILNVSTFVFDDLKAANLLEEEIAAIYIPQVKHTKGVTHDAVNQGTKTYQSYRFDDRLNDATLTKAASPMADENKISFEFDGKDGQSWVPTNQNHVSTSAENGLLEVTVKNQNGGIESKDLNIPAEKIFGMVLRMKVSKGDSFKLMWKRTGDEEFHESVISVRIPENDKFLIYDIKAYGLRGWNGVIDHIRLYPADKGDSKVELDYIRFLSESSYFSDKKIGVDDYEIGSEVRRVIFTHSPSSIAYRLKVPPESFLSFGAGIIDTDVPTDFEVTLGADGKTERVYAKKVQEKKWEDAKIDMSKWQGSEVVITFKTFSEKTGGVAFWSNPILWQKEKRPNVIVYVIDCLRADHVGAYGYKRPTTPHIDSFAKGGALFLNAYSQETWTRPSVTSLMTSQYVSTHKVNELGKQLPDSADTIADVMREGGYRTVIITDNPNASVESNLDQGFEQVFLKGSSEDNNRLSKNISTVTNWLEDNAKGGYRNFFMYIQTLELHAPYLPPPPYDKLYDPDYKGMVSENGFDIYKYKDKELSEMLNERDISYIIALYDGLLNLADKRFNILVETLKAMGAYDNTVIIVTADHGEAFSEHGQWTHGDEPYQQLIRVPLMMRFPSSVPAGRVVDENVQLIDIAPTILHMVGLKPEDDFQGLSLLPLIKNQNIDMYKDRTVFTESRNKVALINGKQKFIMERPVNQNAGSIERIFRSYVIDYVDFWKTHKLFDLENDPAEKYNVAGRESSKSGIYEKSIVEWLEVQDRSRLTERESGLTDTQTIDPKVQQELEALGYVQ